jgi:hypothetical protein
VQVHEMNDDTHGFGDGDARINVSMVGNVVVLRPRGRLDLESTHALVTAVDAASDADTAVMIDLDGTAPENAAELVYRSSPTPPYGMPLTLATSVPTIGVIGPGCVRLSAPNNHWTIDLSERRFCRSAEPVDRRFVPAENWTSIRNIWAASEGVAVLTLDDSVISTAIPWIVASAGAA